MIFEYTNGHHHNDVSILTPEGSNTFQVSLHRFQGTVRLRVDAIDSVLSVISFVDTLRQKHNIRVIELVGSVAGGVDIWLTLPKPIDFVSTLRQIEGVSRVETHRGIDDNSDEPQVYVQLAGYS